MFKVAGVSILKGEAKVRFANDMTRVKVLDKNGHTDVELVTLPHEMTKAEIAQHLTEIGFGAGKPAVQAAIAYIAKKNPAVEAGKAPAVKAAAVTA